MVILGQDPYHNYNQAHGLAFSVRPPTPAPPSLRNMYTCLKNDYPRFNAPPKNGGLLTPWAQRGVLMLNTCLTVRAHEANSHSNRGWERFTQRVIDLVAARRARGVVFMAWGTPAGKRVQRVDTARHLVLKSVHPSPLSAARGFFTCAHFRLANEWLAERYGPAGRVDWALNEGESIFDDGDASAGVGVGVGIGDGGAGDKGGKEEEVKGEKEEAAVAEKENGEKTTVAKDAAAEAEAGEEEKKEKKEKEKKEEEGAVEEAEAVVKASADGANVAKEEAAVAEKKGTVPAGEGDENVAPAVEA